MRRPRPPNAEKTSPLASERGERLPFQTRRKAGSELFFVQIGQPAAALKAQALCHQQLAVHAVFFVEGFVAVLVVARHGVADERHVRADLMRFAAVQADIDQRIFGKVLPQGVFGDDLFRPLLRLCKHAHAGGALVLPKIRLQTGGRLGKGVEAHGLVQLFRPPLAEGGEQFFFRRGV